MKLYMIRFDSLDYAVVAESVSDAIALWAGDWMRTDGDYAGQEPESITLVEVEKIITRREHEEKIRGTPVIVVNGRSCAVARDQKTVSYEDIVTTVAADGSLLTITYRSRHPGIQINGTLVPGQSVPVSDGMIFSAYRTDGA